MRAHLAIALTAALVSGAATATPPSEAAIVTPKVSEEDRAAAEAVRDRAEREARGLSINQEVISQVAESQRMANEMKASGSVDPEELQRRVDAYKADIEALMEGVDQVDPDHAPSFREILGEGDLAEAAQRELDAAIKEAAAIDAAEPAKPRYRLFVSRSMGEEALQEAIAYGKKHQDMVIAFRGLKPEEKVMDLVNYLRTLQEPAEDGSVPLAAVQLDPPAFKDSGVSVVPTLERLDEEGKVIATVRGIANPEYLENLVVRGERGDLGSRGTTSEILEEDLIVAMQRKFNEFDWEGGMRRAQDRFWRIQAVQPVVEARRNRRRLFDPSVEVQDDLVTAAGTVLMRKGDRINPLESMPLDDTILVFDGTNEAHLKWVDEQLKVVSTKNYWLVTTQVDVEKDNGWGSFTSMMERFNDRVFFLLPGQMERMGLERVPSRITQAGNQLQIDEFVVAAQH
jgi:conjugal transfer pilus assembly protein TraW